MNMGAENCGLQKGEPMMNNNYRSFFGLKKQPFGADINLNEILKTAELIDVKERFDYVIGLGAIGLITGEVGSGKSTAIRYAAEHLHPSEYKSLYMTASSGAIMELYRQLVNELGIYIKTNSKTMMLRLIKKEIGTLVCEKKIKVVLLIDEASLMRLEVFAELHTLCQFEKDSKPYLPIILAGQNNLIDKLSYRSSQPLASRVVARSHLQGTDLSGMQDYLKHHLAIAGIKHNLFDQNAITAIHQGSGKQIIWPAAL
jgi:type II secretory pathway predicted ATPase ExeA